MENPQNNPALVIPEKLIVGNQDSLTIFANEAQNKLRVTSKTIAEIAMSSTKNLELIINQIMIEIDAIQVPSIRKEQSKFELFKSGERMKLVRKYEAIFRSINDMALALRLQQATLIKENSRLKSLVPVLEECSTAFVNNLSIGEELLKELNQSNYLSNNQIAFSIDDIGAWQSRLERKLEDIRISHVVSMQNITQVKVMILNNQQIIDRITSAVTNSIPIWRTQVILSLNIEKLESELYIQNKIASTVSQALGSTGKSLRKVKKNASIDKQKLNETNQALCNTLMELLTSEQKLAEAKNTFSTNANKE